MRKKHFKYLLMVLSILVLFPLFFQNCTPVRISESTTISASKSQNGGPYSGMAKIYHHFNAVLPCPVKDSSGAALPNIVILFKSGPAGLPAPYLARESCQDLSIPTLIAESDLRFIENSTETFFYKGLLVSAYRPTGDFSVVAAQCPAGKTEIPGALRTNLYANSLDWTIPQNSSGVGWYFFPGIRTSLFSTIQSLPAYLIDRDDPANLDHYRRPTQYIRLKPNTQYALSFLSQSGSMGGADVNIYRRFNPTAGPTDETVLLTFDFKAGTIKTEWAINLPPLQATMTPLGNGFLCTVYFTTSSNPSTVPMDIGVTPTTYGQMLGQVGDSVLATAGQLVEVDQFCQ